MAWTEFWARAEGLGLRRDRPALEAQIGPLGADPEDAWRRLAAWAATHERQGGLR